MPILKKIFFLSIFLFFFALLLWGVYIISFKKGAPGKTPENVSSQPAVQDTLVKQSREKIAAISNEDAISITSLGAKVRFFSKYSKEAFEIDLNTLEKKNLGSGRIGNMTDAFWSTDGQKAILRLKDAASNISYVVYDFSNNTQRLINKPMEDIYWQENASRIFYKFFDAKTKERTLNVSDPDGANWKRLADVPYRYMVAASVPKSGLVSFWNSGNAWDETALSIVPIVGGEQKTIMKDRYGADYLWSPDGMSALMSHSERKGGNKMQLAIINSNGGEYKNLDIPTFITKCTWSKDGKTVFYALPGGIPQDVVLPNDYKTGNFQTTDTFWKVDVTTGQKERILEPEEIKNKFDATHLSLNEDESLLIFLNKLDGLMYRIAL